MHLRFGLLLLAAAAACGDGASSNPPIELLGPNNPLPISFGPREDLGLVEASELTEASGMVASRQHHGVLWSHNDSGDGAYLFALGDAGEDLGRYALNGVQAFDWEDIAIGPGPLEGVDYLYVGDIGDNDAVASSITIFRAPEPEASRFQVGFDRHIDEVEAFHFVYPGGARDAETLLVEPDNGDIYIVSKREAAAQVYRAQAPHTVGVTRILEQVASLDFTGATAGDISPIGDEILIKTYQYVFHWRRPLGTPLIDAFALEPAVVPYVSEPQGESVTWAANRMGYYTVSEEPLGVEARLYFYPRLLD